VSGQLRWGAGVHIGIPYYYWLRQAEGVFLWLEGALYRPVAFMLASGV
jgi:hypothetical protein